MAVARSAPYEPESLRGEIPKQEKQMIRPTRSSHHSSLLVGAGLAAFAILGFDSGFSSSKPQRVQLVDPHPATIVRITEGTPYKVPPNKGLALKLFGTTLADTAGGAMIVVIDGVQVLGLRTDNEGTKELATPVPVLSGQTVEIQDLFPDPGSTKVAFGILYDS
jgi:hypothetical protein